MMVKRDASGSRDRGRDRPDAAPGTARGPHRIHSASAHRRAAGPAAAALSRDRERLAGGAGGGNDAPSARRHEAGEIRRPDGCSGHGDRSRSISMARPPGPRPLIPSPHAESSTPIAIRPGPHAGRCRRTTAADRTPPCAHPHDTAPPPACASRPPPPAGHPLRYGPSWPRTRDARRCAAPAAAPRNRAIVATAHCPAC